YIRRAAGDTVAVHKLADFASRQRSHRRQSFTVAAIKRLAFASKANQVVYEPHRWVVDSQAPKLFKIALKFAAQTFYFVALFRRAGVVLNLPVSRQRLDYLGRVLLATLNAYLAVGSFKIKIKRRLGWACFLTAKSAGRFDRNYRALDHDARTLGFRHPCVVFNVRHKLNSYCQSRGRSNFSCLSAPPSGFRRRGRSHQFGNSVTNSDSASEKNGSSTNAVTSAALSVG